MEVVAASVVAVFGTLLGSVVTHVFQRRTVIRSERFTRGERLRQERIDAFSVFGGALANYRRGQMDLWFAMHVHHAESELLEMRREAQRLRAAALEAMFRVQLLTEASDVVEAARRAVRAIDQIDRAETRTELDQERVTSRTLVYNFISTAKPHTAVPGEGH
ncbi:hypothetical protein GCM10010400_12330 [Streptomyces aculeolatus]|uniref:hypothetical protein n=1 Tax=Streptomyces aculeolatus TaxID=270689 RepID=UPI001CEC9159|nr:hypothetical protein [Streptomyces aculeolatus]